MCSIINAMKPLRKDAIVLIVSNPNDVLTSLAQEISGLPRSQVIGSGTSLDSVRLRRLLANQLDVRICALDRNSDVTDVCCRLPATKSTHTYWASMEILNSWLGHVHRSPESPSTKPCRPKLSTVLTLLKNANMKRSTSSRPKDRSHSVSAPSWPVSALPYCSTNAMFAP